jgi:hypothetical protein
LRNAVVGLQAFDTDRRREPTMSDKPPPASSSPGSVPGPEAIFHAHLKAGRFMLQRSRGTGEFLFYPRIADQRLCCDHPHSDIHP